MTIKYVAKKVKREVNILFWVTMGIFFAGFCFGRAAHASEMEKDPFAMLNDCRMFSSTDSRMFFWECDGGFYTETRSCGMDSCKDQPLMVQKLYRGGELIDERVLYKRTGTDLFE